MTSEAESEGNGESDYTVNDLRLDADSGRVILDQDSIVPIGYDVLTGICIKRGSPRLAVRTFDSSMIKQVNNLIAKTEPTFKWTTVRICSTSQEVDLPADAQGHLYVMCLGPHTKCSVDGSEHNRGLSLVVRCAPHCGKQVCVHLRGALKAWMSVP